MSYGFSGEMTVNAISRRQLVIGAAALSMAPRTAFAATKSVPYARLAKFRDEAKALGVRALVLTDASTTLLSDGKVDEVRRIASCRKSFVSALYGIAVAEGSMKLDTTLKELGVDDYDRLTDVERGATIRDLIKARSGIYLPTAAESPAMKAERPARGSHPPGTFWYYNNWDFNVLGEIYQRVTGEDLFGAIEQRLLHPIGYEDFDRLRDMQWGYDPAYPRFPAYNMWMSARDMAKFGQLFLRRGEWAGKQIVPANWIDESTTVYSMTHRYGWGSGYGYMWWIATNRNGATNEGVPVGSYTAAGNGGRYISIFPEHGLVIAIQSEEEQGKPQAEIYTDKTAYARILRNLFA
jgi:CubicO group peptidase (beta-lactamase class C family)